MSDSSRPTPTAGATVEFRQVSFAWPSGAELTRSLNLKAEGGAITALVGPSGCGKSTLLRLAADLLLPQGGEITAGEQRRAFVFQRPTLLPWRSVRANVALPMELQGSVDDAAVDAALERVGLLQSAELLPQELSGGMQMRASLARALVNQPGLLLMDEPFSALDALTRARMHQYFLKLWRELRFTALLVTHDIEEAVLLADRVIVLDGPPVSVAMQLPIALPRPRDNAVKHSPALGGLVQRLHDALGEAT